MEQDDWSTGSISPLLSSSNTVIITIEADSPESNIENIKASKGLAPYSAQNTNVEVKDGQVQVPAGCVEHQQNPWMDRFRFQQVGLSTSRTHRRTSLGSSRLDWAPTEPTDGQDQVPVGWIEHQQNPWMNCPSSWNSIRT